MRIAYLDCSAGVSGNMLLGALLSAGLPQEALEADLGALQVPGWQLQVSAAKRQSISGLHVAVVATREEHAHRNLHDIEHIVAAAPLPDAVRETAMQVFALIAEAEGRVHGVAPSEVHFHEVGAVDSIVDVVGVVAGFHRLNLDHIVCSPVHMGTGFVHAAHGRIPVPAPATLEILKGAPVYATDVVGELATPTGAALVRTLAREFGPWPQMRVEQIGYGLGTKEFPIPNVLRLAIGTLVPGARRVALPAHAHTGSGEHGHTHVHHEHGHHEYTGHEHADHEHADHEHADHEHADHEHAHPAGTAHSTAELANASGLDRDSIQVLETNLDDMNPEFCDHVTRALLATGAVDAHFTPVVMKKGRPALKLTVLCPAASTEACVKVLLRETTALGVRMWEAGRLKLQRSWLRVPVAGCEVRVKLGLWGDEVVNVAPEHDDCCAVAQRTGKPLKTVYEQAKNDALRQIGEAAKEKGE